MSKLETPDEAPERTSLAKDANTIDLAGVDPLRREEVQRRISVVRRYLLIPAPSSAERQEHAAALDISVNQFMALVRAWREHRSAIKMAGSGAHRGKARQPSRLALNPIAREETSSVIDQHGPDASLINIVRHVGARCDAVGVTPPSRSTIWNIMAARRQDQNRDSGNGGIVVGRCGVRLPMAVGNGIDFPMITLAVRATDGAILAASLEEADWQAKAKILALLLSDRPLRVDRNLLSQKRRMSVETGIEPVPAVKARSSISRLLGVGIANIRLIYQLSKAVPPERLLTTPQDMPLLPIDVREIVTAAVARHNAARGIDDAFWIDQISASTFS